MKRISRPMLGLISAVAGGVIVFGLIQFNVLGKETNNPAPHFNISNTPIDRETSGLTTFAPVIKRAAPSVVNIYSTRTIRMRRMPSNPFFDDPLFRQFFGGDQEESLGGQNDRGNRQGQTLTRKQQSLGSGIIVSPEGYVLTANHVVDGADPDGVKVSLAEGGREFVAKIVGTDPQTDVAVLKIDAGNLSAITIADSDNLAVGDIVLAIGNPFGVGQTVTMGIVSALGRTSLGIIPRGYENFIQTDAAINQGNSGGALIDAQGRLVGINSAIFTPSGGNAGIGFAVPINLARNVMERLITSGKVTRGFLGVGLQPEITSEIAEQFGLPDLSGAMITETMPGTPAARAGLVSGDVIVQLDGKNIRDSDQLRLMVSQLSPGTKVTMKVLHSEPGEKPREKTVTVTLGAMTPEQARASGPRQPSQNQEPQSAHDALNGVEVTDLDANLRRQLDIPANVNGAVVTQVESGSNAAESGLRQGDVILEIDRKRVRSADDAVELSDAADRDTIMLRVWRNGGSIFMTVDNRKKSE